MAKVANLEAFAHSIITHAKDAFVALHGEDLAKKYLPQLVDMLKAKAEDVLLKQLTK